MDDVLIWCYRKLGPVARRLRVQKIARRVYEGIASRRYPNGKLSSATQNGRTWRLRRDVAERGALQEFETTSWLRSVVREGMTVIDVGANVGQMTLEMAVLVGPRGRVFAIEPGEGNLEYLREHVQGNGLSDRVEVIAAACAEVDGGEVTFFIGSTDGVSSVGSGHNIVGAEAITKQGANLHVRQVRVPRVSIDGMCARLGIRPAVIKIDVEGAELLVMKGAQETLRHARPELRVGFHPFAFEDPHAASKELFALAEAAGYRIHGVTADRPLELAEYNMSPV